jgi:peptide/nickel transport system permease protein
MIKWIRSYARSGFVARVSAWFIGCLLFTAVFADFIANEKPIVAAFEDGVHFPILQEYLVAAGITTWDKKLLGVEWKSIDYDWAIWPPIPYIPQNIDFENAGYVSPFGGQQIDTWHDRHWLGTDEIGRDVMAGMIYGARIALLVGIVAMAIATFLGLFFGALAGYFGDHSLRASRASIVGAVLFLVPAFFYGYMIELHWALGTLVFVGVTWVGGRLGGLLGFLPFLRSKVRIPLDLLVSRLIELVVTIPRFFLIITIVAVSKPSIYLVMIIIGLTSWTGIARFVRAELLRIRETEYIEAAHAMGFSHWRTIIVHALPNGLTPVFVAVSFGLAAAILIESTLSFLGIGVSPDTVTWGSLLSLAREAPREWWLALFPGIAIFATITVLNLLGEHLSDKLDPREKA